MPIGESRARAAIAGVAAGGALLGHQLTYLLVRPSGPGASVAAAEHGWLSWASDLIVVVTVCAIAAMAIGRLVRSAGGRGIGVRELAAFQVGAFAAVEILERVAAGAPVSDLGVILPIGALVQIAVAALGVAVMRRILGMAQGVRESALAVDGTPRPRSAWIDLVASDRAAVSTDVVAAAWIRGPPPLLPH